MLVHAYIISACICAYTFVGV